MKRGFVCGAFDLLHAGHVHILRKCKERCDYLLVGLHVDPSVERKGKNKPVETILERQIKLRACKYVDGVIVYGRENELTIMKELLDLDVRFLGTDYKDSDKPITDMGIPIEYVESVDIHTTGLRKRIKEL